MCGYDRSGVGIFKHGNGNLGPSVSLSCRFDVMVRACKTDKKPDGRKSFVHIV